MFSGHIPVLMCYFFFYRQKRKKRSTESKCDDTSKPKRHRLSVLRLSGETGRGEPSSPAHDYLQEDTMGRRVGRSAHSHTSLGENVKESRGFMSIPLDDSGEDGREEQALVQESSKDVHFHNLDHNIVQFTVGANVLTDVLLPITGSSLDPVDIIGSPAKPNPTEPSEYTLPPPTALMLMILHVDYSFFTVV